MALQWSAVTLAAHVCLILSVIFAFGNAAALVLRWRSHHSVVTLAPLEWPLICVSAALILERSYYVAARLLVGSQFDLWEAHPAPEFLSLMVAGAFMFLATRIGKVARPYDSGVVRATVVQSLLLGVVALSLSWSLW